MKKTILIAVIALASGARTHAQTADSLGLPGDDLDLYGVIDLFKASSSLEDFEKKLNEETNQLNNLDLDGDGNVDYISVVDNVAADAHAIQLQVAVNDTERQDVAVIEVEKTGTETADLQVVGDEELYGKDYIIEANDNAASSSEAHLKGFRASVVIVNVWVWPCVKFIYAPGYVVWASPWHYRHYPGWWKPWHPVAWGVYHPRVVRYHHPYYHCVHVHRVTHAHVVYVSHHRAAPSVHRRMEQQHANGKMNPPRDHGSGHATGKQGKPAKQPSQGPRGGKQSGPKKSPGPKGGRH